MGGIPVITRFAARQFSNDIRLEAAAFVRQMYLTSTLTLQMFVSCGGISVLAGFLDEDYDSSRELVLTGVNGIWSVFELQGPTPKNDFCRLFSKAKVLDPLAELLHRVLDTDEEDDDSDFVEGRIVDLFYLFSQADKEVKELVADRAVLKSMLTTFHLIYNPNHTDTFPVAVLKGLQTMTPTHQITMLKFIKNISTLPTTVQVLHSADAIDYLIDLLGYSMKKNEQHAREISNQILNTMYNLCRLSKERQEYAAVHGLIPLLLKVLDTQVRPPKEFALPILCDMAHSGSKGRRYLWQNDGLDFYVTLLADEYWQTTALDAIFVWLQEETAKVEGHLMSSTFTEAIVKCFKLEKPNSNPFAAFDPMLLEPLLKVLRLSPALASSLAQSEMYAGIAAKLCHKKPVVRLNLLRLVRNIMDACDPDMGINITSGGTQLQSLFESIRMLEKDQAVLVRNLAQELVKTHIEGDYFNAKLNSSSSNAGGSGRSRSGGSRRTTTNYTPTNSTPPTLHSIISPVTPTHYPPLRHTDSVSIVHQIAHTPRRSQVTMAYGQDSTPNRPHSRDAMVPHVVRRASGDVAARSRLPRGSVSYTRPSTSSAASSSSHNRSESSLSNKENTGRHPGTLNMTPSSPVVERERGTPSGPKRRPSRMPSSEMKP